MTVQSVNRVTGLSGLIDVDSLVTATMKPYKQKADNYWKETKQYEYKQELYRDCLKKFSDFYENNLTTNATDSLFKASNWAAASYTSSDESVVVAKGLAGADVSKFTVTSTKMATAARLNLSAAPSNPGDASFKDTVAFALRGGIADTISFDVNNQDGTTKNYKIDISAAALKDEHGNVTGIDEKVLAKKINAALSAENAGFSASYSEVSHGVVIKSDSLGAHQNFSLSLMKKNESTNPPTYNSTTLNTVSAHGSDAEMTVKNAYGEEYTYTGANNTVTIDNVEYTINGNMPSGSVSLSGKVDINDVKKKLVKFVDDYNKMLTDINTMLWEKHDKSYTPLTEDEKKDMTESQIKLWETKVKTGLLRSDPDVTSVINKMKSVMSSVMPALKKFGINRVNDYTIKSGTFSIDETKLDEALKNNAGAVKNLFKNLDNPGILDNLHDVLYDVTVNSKSTLLNKVGIENGKNALTNTYTETINKRKDKYDKMVDENTKRENDLYTKYSRLESALAKLNSQQESLAGLMGSN